MERKLRRIKNAKLLLIPASPGTSGHGTTSMAKFWKQQLTDILETTPNKAM